MLLGLSWRRWGDPQVDVGTWMETARLLARGGVLHRDVETLHGPLSAHLDALALRLAGPSVLALVLVQLAVLAGVAALLRHLLGRIASPLARTAGLLLFVLVFAVGQSTRAGGYDYLTPYAPELTHGLMLGLAAVAASARAYESGRPAGQLGAGLLLGLCFLTKAEPFAAAAAACAAGAMLAGRAGGGLRPALALAGGSLAAPAAALGLSLRSLPWPTAVESVLGSWARLGASFSGAQPFYRETMGTDDVAGRLAKVLAAGLLWAAAAGAALGLAALARRGGARRTAAWIALAGLSAVLLAYHGAGWVTASAPAVPFLAAAALVWSVAAERRLSRGPVSPQTYRRITFGVLAVSLTAKVVLNARYDHYGFVLVMPATLLVVVALLDWLPERLPAARFDRRLFAAALVAVLAVFSWNRLLLSYRFRHEGRPCSLGSGADQAWTDPRGCLVQAAIDELGRIAPPGATLAVLPEGALVNFLTRRPSTVPYLDLMPFPLATFGEGKVLAAFEAAAPDFVLLMARDTGEQGAAVFGRDYAREVGAFLARRYESLGVMGEAPGPGRSFRIQLLRRRAR